MQNWNASAPGYLQWCYLNTLRLFSFKTPHLVTSKHILLSKLVLFVLIGGFPYLQACIVNRKYIIEFLCTSFAFFHHFACRCSCYSVFLFPNTKFKMYRCTFNWENPFERLWEFPYQLLETNRIFYICMVLQNLAQKETNYVAAPSSQNHESWTFTSSDN